MVRSKREMSKLVQHARLVAVHVGRHAEVAQLRHLLVRLGVRAHHAVALVRDERRELSGRAPLLADHVVTLRVAAD
eukprot:2011117-Prymnesium_polylepis.1